MFTTENLICSTRKDALAQGLQTDVDTLDPEVRSKAGILYPAFITNSVMNIINESSALGICDFKGILWDICYMFAYRAKRNTQNINPMKYIVYINKKRYDGNINAVQIEFYAQMGLMDTNDSKTAITIMTERDL
jgi:hypothetical protein